MARGKGDETMTAEATEEQIAGEIAALESELATLLADERARLSTAGPIEAGATGAVKARAEELRAQIHESRIRLAQVLAAHHEAEYVKASEAARVARTEAIAARAAVVAAEDAAGLASRKANGARSVAMMHRDKAQRHAEEAQRLVRERLAGLKGF